MLLSLQCTKMLKWMLKIFLQKINYPRVGRQRCKIESQMAPKAPFLKGPKVPETTRIVYYVNGEVLSDFKIDIFKLK